MNNHILKENIGKLVGQRNSFLFFSFILSLAVLLLSCLLIFKKERTVILPTTGPLFWIEDQRASNVYVEKMGFFLSDLLLNRSPVDVERRNQMILEHVHPTAYHDFKKLLRQEQESMVKMGQSFFFQIERSFVDYQSFVIEGESVLALKKEGMVSSIAQKKRNKYTFQFQCENGRLLLTALKKEEV